MTIPILPTARARAKEFNGFRERPCQSWVPGHRVHWVQGMRSNRSDTPGSYVPCMIIDISVDGWFTLVLTDTGETRRYWTHDIEKLRVLFGEDRVEINEHWSVIHQRVPGGGSTNYMSITQDPRPCVFTDPDGELHEQLETHGGFSISGEEALRRIRAREGQETDEPGNDR